MEAIREVQRFDTKPEAEDAMLEHAQMLCALGQQEQFGVFVERVHAGSKRGRYRWCWAVCVLDRSIAPTQEAARRRVAG